MIDELLKSPEFQLDETFLRLAAGGKVATP
jgi:hypothetical protein